VQWKIRNYLTGRPSCMSVTESSNAGIMNGWEIWELFQTTLDHLGAILLGEGVQNLDLSKESCETSSVP